MGDKLSLDVVHIIRGYFYDSNGDPIANAGVTIHNRTDASYGDTVTTTDANGYFQYNIKEICSEGDELTITYTSGTDEISEYMTVNLNRLSQDVSATLQNQFKITTNTFELYMPMPRINGIKVDLSKNLALFNFWSENIAVDDRGKDSEPLTLDGQFYVDVYSRDSISGKLEVLHDIANEDEEITISGLHDIVDGVYIIKSISFNNMTNTTDGFNWTLQLELVRK